jgi:hypothetical protein
MTLALAAALISGYDSVEIELPFENSYVIEAHAGEDGLVAGYAVNFLNFDPYLSSLASPFVWHKGKGHILPTGKGKYGHVRAIGPDCLLGDVFDQEKGVWMPTKWTPDSELGWSDATASLLTKEKGIARQIDPDGTIWIESSEFVGQLRPGKLTKIPLENYDFERVDKQGRIFVNTYSNLGLHGSREDSRACYIQDGKKHLLADEGKFTRIDSVTADGVALVFGAYPYPDFRQAIWREGTLNPVESPLSHVGGITDDGTYFGTFRLSDEDYYPAIVVDGKVLDIRSAVPAITVTDLYGLSARGQIMIRSGNPHQHQRFYLLTPQRDFL